MNLLLLQNKSLYAKHFQNFREIFLANQLLQATANSRPHLREQTYSVDVNYCRLLQFSPYVCSKVRHLGTEDHPVRIEPAIFKIFSTITYRNSHRRYSIKKVFLKILQNSQENTCARVSFLTTLLKKTVWHRCFPVNLQNFFTEYLRTTASVLNLFVW